MNTKIKFVVVLFFATLAVWSQESVDMVMPKNGAFNAGVNLEGLISNSVNEVTGKAVISVPLASVVSRSVSHNVGLLYSGQLAFETAKNTNKFNPTSVAGVGFSLMVPKIVVDNKSTATREDDEFYLQDGANNTKLVCVAKTDQQISSNEWIKDWDFVTEKYTTLKIKFNSREYNGIFTIDNFVVTTDQGIKYTYGGSYDDGLNANEKVVAWGNWIGDSKLNSGGTAETIVWNLSKIEDQWGNNITFQYNLVQQPMGGTYQTEASYLSKMISSTGEYVLFEYLDKLPEEYYEPHKEQQEPDAFQERYEKKYLAFVKSYNSKNALASSVELQYKINYHESVDKKRFLEKIIQKGKQGNAMPPQVFEYYENGDFLGGIKKITYPMGGSVTYSYENKSLFFNQSNLFDQSLGYDGFIHSSILTRDNYVLHLLISENSVGDNRYVFKIRRYFWNGQKWEVNEHIIPHHIKHTNTVHLENFEPFFMDDAYGYIYKFNEYGINHQDEYDINIFYLKKDGKTWGHFSDTNYIRGGNGVLLQGDNFIGISEPEPHDLEYTNEPPTSVIDAFVRVGDDWIRNGIVIPIGKYIFSAHNNYISVIKKGGLSEFQINTLGLRADEYYLYYLDSNREWVKKDWTNNVRSVIRDLEDGVGFMYCGNSNIGLMAKGGAEYILSWDKDYNLLTPFAFGVHHDYNPIINVASNMLTLQSDSYGSPIKSMRFNGQNWSIYELGVSSNSYKTTYGKDCFAFQNHLNTYTTGLVIYDSNNSVWNYTYLSNIADFYLRNLQLTGINNEFVIAGNKIFKFNNSSVLPAFSQDIISFKNSLTFSDGLSKTYVKLKDYYINGSGASEVFRKSLLYYINKNTGNISSVDLGIRENMSTETSRFGGATQFLSPKSIFLKQNLSSGNFLPTLFRLIDDKIDDFVYDIVVDKIEINDGVQANSRTIDYDYLDYSCTPNNDVVYYGTVTVEDKGYGSSSNGKVVKTYSNGKTDLSFAGLLLEEEVKDINNNRLAYKLNQYEKIIRLASGSIGIKRSNVNLKKSEEKVYKNPGSSDFMLTETYYTYTPEIDPRNLLLSTRKVAKDIEEITELSYAYKQSIYSDFESRNLVSYPYEVKTKINNKESSVKRYIWTKTSDLNKVYNSNILQGVTSTSLRNGSTTNSKIDDFGHAIEVSDNRGVSYKEQFTSMLYGYGFKFPVASISNAKYEDVINSLDVTLQNLQTLSNSALKTELMKLYQRLPNAAISLIFYDDDGRVIEKIDNRERSIKHFYDEFGRLDYVVDHENNVVKKHIYNLIQN